MLVFRPHAQSDFVTLARGHTRLDWTADRTYPRLVDFYKSLGAQPQEEKVFFRLSGDALKQLQQPAADSRTPCRDPGLLANR